MAKENRPIGQVPDFATTGAPASDLYVFGTTTESTNVSELIGPSSRFGRGYGFVQETSPETKPDFQLFNALMYSTFKLHRHVYQNGMPEWSVDETYYINSLTNRNGVVYRSKTDANTGNDPATDANETNWDNPNANDVEPLDTLADLRALSTPYPRVRLSGYDTKNDGAFGSNIHRLKGTATTEVDNGGTVILVTINAVVYVYELQYIGAIFPEWFGAKGDDATDNFQILQDLFDWLPDNNTVQFSAGIYRISERLMLKGTDGSTISKRNISIFGGEGVFIKSTNISAGYPRDGFTVGNPSATDGGTGTTFNIKGVVVDGFEFINCRIGVWVVYADTVFLNDIKADRTAVVAVGNDADNNCRNIHLNNITRTAAFDGTFFTVGFFSTQYFTVSNLSSLFAVSGSALTIKTSVFGTLNNIVIEQADQLNTGIEIQDGSQYITISNFSITRALKGIVTFDNNPATRDKISVIGNGTINACGTAIDSQAGGVKYNNIQTISNGTSVRFLADSVGNSFSDCNFREAVLDDAFSVRSLNTFRSCLGISNNGQKYANILSADTTTLDYYEEGAFTPTLSFGETSVGITYAAQVGKYTRVGNIVTGTATIVLATKGTSVGIAEINGLPFICGASLGSASTILKSNYATAFVSKAYVQALTSKIALTIDGGVSFVLQADTDFLDNTRIDISFTYLV